MKLNSKLWMLAVAMATVGCQDDIDDRIDKGSNGANGPQTYMKVNINTETVTKAPQGDTGKPSGGEDGDDFEVGEKYEYNVDDVTIVLFRNADNSPVDEINPKSVLVAAGYASNGNGMEDSEEPQHSKMATVTLNVTNEAENFDGQTYGVIAITNLGAKSVLADRISTTDIHTGAQLANYLQKKVYTSNDGSVSKFIMSSHLPDVETITLEAGATEKDAPETNVHVERLAAKIRINDLSTTSGEQTTYGNYIYEIKEGETSNQTTVAKVRLDQVAVVNQLTSGTYLLKRVTSSVTTSGTEPDMLIPAVANDTYLGNELWSATSANYVIDPWTRNKNLANVSNVTSITAATGVELPSGETTSNLSFANQFTGTNYSGMWSVLNDKQDLANTKDTDGQIDLAYVQENTTSADNSLNGYSTGLIFRATYFPAKVSAIGGEESNQIVTESVSGFDYFDKDTQSGLPTFYVYNNVAYKDSVAIWAEHVWGYQKTVEQRNAVDYDDFLSSGITSLSHDAFMKSDLAKSLGDPFGYIAFLKTKVGEPTEGAYSGNFTTNESFEAYLKTDAGQEAMLENVNRYIDGVCYYPFWIRHANNDKASVMGVMEFGIVRNNIYDVTVEGINGFGLSGTDKPDPTIPDEEDSYFMKVNLFVRDWVVRSNSGIIL